MIEFIPFLLAQADNPFKVQVPARNPFVVVRQPDRPKVVTPPPKPEPLALVTYPTALARSAKDKRPIVVFVGVPARKCEGCHVVYKDSWPGEVDGAAIMVGTWNGGSEMERHDLVWTATDEEIRKAAFPVARMSRVMIQQPVMVYRSSQNC